MHSLITLTTDFGLASPYAATMKGVILSINPDARIHDLSHSIPPRNIRHAAHFLRAFQARHPGTRAWGLGGPELRAAGLESLARMEDLAVVAEACRAAADLSFRKE